MQETFSGGDACRQMTTGAHRHGPHGGIFLRTFLGFLALTLATVLLFTFFLTATLQAERQAAYEDEVRAQAREVAGYVSHLNQLQFVFESSTMRYVLLSKMQTIHDHYNADVWIVSYDDGRLIYQFLDSGGNIVDPRYISSEAVLAQIASVYQGNEIRVQGLFPELGEDIVTIGVPWRYSDGHVVGAVLLNISTEDLRVRFMDVLPSLLPVGVGVLILGVFCSLLLARSLTRPLKEITAAVRDFSKGHLDRRVQLTCGGELQALGDEIDRMAFELSNMEESRKSFVANVSHELRSPLTSIRGYVQALRDGAIPEEEREKYMDVVLDETARLTALVRDLLDLSRIESGKFPMEMARVDLCEQMRRSLLSFEGRIEEKRVEVAAELPETPCWVMADAGRIRQVIGNLIDNALKFLPEGGTLRVGVGSAGKRVYAYVEDNGPGIAKDDLPFIFDRFYKADKAHTAGMGTGLGLSIVKRILEQHGGDISVSSEPGRTVFRFELDAAPEEKKPALPPQ